jgi:hypothetical protein
MHNIIKAIRGNIVAWLALFVALGGTGLAASHYVITSTKQIKPSVLRKLRGHQGPQGPPGLTGPAGPQGAPANEAKVNQLQNELNAVTAQVRGLCFGINLAEIKSGFGAISEPGKWKAIDEVLEEIKSHGSC